MSEIMSDAINLMLVGMGFVFMFLAILVLVTHMMSWLVIRFRPEIEQTSAVSSSTIADNNNAGIKPFDDHQLMAVLSAAVAKYRLRHKK